MFLVLGIINLLINRNQNKNSLLIIYFSSLHSTYRTFVILRADVIATTGNSNLFIFYWLGSWDQFFGRFKVWSSSIDNFLALILNVCVYQRDSMLLKGVRTIQDTLLWLASQLNGTKIAATKIFLFKNNFLSLCIL